MRISALLAVGCVLVAPSLLQRSARAEGTTNRQTIKIQLRHLDVDEAVRLLQPRTLPPNRKSFVPAGIEGLLGYPLDRSVLALGNGESLKLLQRGLAVVDVAIEEREGVSQAVITPDRSRAEAVRAALLALPKSGFVRVEGKSLVLTGGAAWIRQSLGTVLGAEFAAGEAPNQ